MGSTYLQVLVIMAALFVFMIPGFILRKCKMVGEGATNVLSTVLLYVCQPAIALNAFCVFSEEDFEYIYSFSGLRLLRNFALCALISIIATVVIFLICRLVFIKWKNRGDANIYTFIAVMSNCGFLGIPFIDTFTDGNALACMYMMIFNIVFLAFAWTLGVYLVTGDRKKVKIRKFLLHPSIIASVVALILFFVPQINFFMMDPVKDFQIIPEYLSDMTAPLSMLVVGIRLADIKPRALFCNPGIYLSSFLRLIVAPMVTLGIGLLFKGLLNTGPEFGYEEYVYLAPAIAMAMSPAASVVAMAETFDGNKELATSSFMTATLLSIVVIPLTVTLIMMLA